jgi:hypothetical protein
LPSSHTAAIPGLPGYVDSTSFVISSPKYKKPSMKYVAPTRGESVLTDEQYLSLLEITCKETLVGVLSKHLRVPLLPRVVCSFDKTDRKDILTPDAFISHPAFVTKRSESAGIISALPARSPMQMDSGIMDFDLDASIDAFRRLKLKLLACRNRCADSVVTKGALVVRKGFWLLTINMDDELHAEEVLWNARDSRERLSNFFAQENPTAKILDWLLWEMKLRLTHDPDCLLGSGRLGSVFRVRACADDGGTAQGSMALKVVAGADNARRLEEEFESNQEICQRQPDVIVKAIDFRRHESFGGHVAGAGMLMDEVGSKVSGTEEGILPKAMHALSDLHRAGYWHGSARLDNLLACGGLGRLKWCDVQRAGPAQAGTLYRRAMFEADLRSLLASHDRACPSPRLV